MRRFQKLVALIMWAVAACAVETRSPQTSGPLVIYDPNDEMYFGHCVNMPLRLLVFDPLVQTDHEGRLRPHLVRRWEVTPDNRRWTVHLRDDVRWHDGMPFTAHDVAFTLNLMAHPEVGWLDPATFTVTVIDDTTYTMEHHGSQAALDISFYSTVDSYNTYYPKHLLEEQDPADLCEWDFWTNPVGTGPYRYERVVPKSLVELRRNEDYFGEKPAIEHVVIRFGGNAAAELLAGTVDIAPVDGDAAIRFEGDDRFNVYWRASTGFAQGIHWNQRVPLFEDARVRRAMTLAIDRTALLAALNVPAGIGLFDVIHSEGQAIRSEYPPPLPHDPDGARTLLAHAGWRDSNGDGVLDRDGIDFRFEAIAPQDAEPLAVFVQAQLHEIGVRMEITSLDYALALQRRRAGDFEAAFHFVRRDIVARRVFEPESPVGAANPEIAGRLARLRDVWNPDERDAIYRELWPHFLAEHPVTVLRPGFGYSVARSFVGGLSNGYENTIMRLPKLWIEEDR